MKKRSRGSYLEERLAIYIERAGYPKPVRELRFHPTRMWRFDLAYPDRGLAIEIEGGTFMARGGRHNRGVGMRQDAEKYNEAALLGWVVVRITGDMFRDGSAFALVDRVMKTEVRYAPPTLTGFGS